MQPNPSTKTLSERSYGADHTNLVCGHYSSRFTQHTDNMTIVWHICCVFGGLVNRNDISAKLRGHCGHSHIEHSSRDFMDGKRRNGHTSSSSLQSDGASPRTAPLRINGMLRKYCLWAPWTAKVWHMEDQDSSMCRFKNSFGPRIVIVFDHVFLRVLGVSPWNKQ